MIRGMGQQFRFTLPYNSQYNFKNTSDITIVFWQDDLPDAEVTKQSGDCTFNEYGTVLYVTLNEADSLKFQTDRKAYVQMKAHTSDGTPFGTKAREFTVYPAHESLLTATKGV